jgi:spore germination protein GerM
MEWKIELKHKTLPDRVEIIGIGKNPRNPVEIITKSTDRLGSKVLDEIRKNIASGPDPVVLWFVESDNDLYFWRFVAARFADDGEWELEDNLPKLELPPSPTADEDERVIIS